MKRLAGLAAALLLIGADDGPAVPVTPQPAKPQSVRSALSSGPDKGCLGRPSDRSSALCAQWSAVDVSAAALKWSEASFWLSIIGALLGLLTTIAAFLAARYAKKAFEAAEIDLRPWLQFTIEPDWSSGREDGYTAAIMVKATNIGRTPAVDISCLSETHRYDDKVADNYFLPFFNSDVFADQNTELVSLLPGESYSFQVLSNVPNDDTKRIPTIGIKLGYKWSNGKRGRTCRAFHSDYRWEGPTINPHTGNLQWHSTEQSFWVAPINVTE